MSMNTNTTTTTNAANAAAHLTFAQALNDAKAMIVQQSSRIKADAEKIKGQNEEIAKLRTQVGEMYKELERLRAVEARVPELTAAKEQAESTVGRQRMHIESLESAARELQRVLGEQAERISHLSAEVEGLREQLPSDADNSALAAMNALLQSTRAARQQAQARQHGGHEQQPPPMRLAGDGEHHDEAERQAA